MSGRMHRASRSVLKPFPEIPGGIPASGTNGPQIARAALGISLGGPLVVYAIVGSQGIGWPIGNDGLLDAAGAITAIGLVVWIVCRAFRR